MISYCIACYRPRYASLLIADLIQKTSAPFEILVWLNIESQEFEHFLSTNQSQGAPIKIVGSTPHNIGMAAYAELFAASRYDMAVQIDDDVIYVSPRIAETADEIFRQFPNVGMLTADVWQDDFTTGARPEMAHYRVFDAQHGLYDGPIDGWFAVYRRSCLHLARTIPQTRYLPLGGTMKHRLAQRRMRGLLCTRMKVFHVIGPQYAHYFDMLDFEIQKYRSLGRAEIVRWYEEARLALPAKDSLEERVIAIRASLLSPP